MQKTLLLMGALVLTAVGYLVAQVNEDGNPRPPRGDQQGPPRHDGASPRPPQHGRPGGEDDFGPPHPPGNPGHMGHSPMVGPPGMPMQPHPLELMLDTDDDGVISVAELENAAASLRKLDRNNDGQLSEREYRPGPPHGGEHRRERPEGPPQRSGRPDRPAGEGDQATSQSSRP